MGILPPRPHPTLERIGGFNTAMGSLWVVMSEMIEAGFTVIAQDADIVWTRDPRPVYSQPSLSARILLQS